MVVCTTSGRQNITHKKFIFVFFLNIKKIIAPAPHHQQTKKHTTNVRSGNATVGNKVLHHSHKGSRDKPYCTVKPKLCKSINYNDRKQSAKNKWKFHNHFVIAQKLCEVVHKHLHTCRMRVVHSNTVFHFVKQIGIMRSC